LKQIRSAAARATIVCAGAAHRPVVERASDELGIARGRIVGSAPHALAAALRALVALESNGSPQDVSLAVLGVPPDRIVVPWDEATIVASAEKTKRLLVVHEAVLTAGFGAEVAATVAEATNARVKRLGSPRIPVPFSPALEAAFRRTPEEIAAAVRAFSS